MNDLCISCGKSYNPKCTNPWHLTNDWREVSRLNEELGGALRLLKEYKAAAQTIRCARCLDDGTIMSVDEYGFPARDYCPECRPLRRLQTTEDLILPQEVS